MLLGLRHDPLKELPARAELHDEVEALRILEDLVELHDVGVVQGALDVHFHLETGGVGDLMSSDPP